MTCDHHGRPSLVAPNRAADPLSTDAKSAAEQPSETTEALPTSGAVRARRPDTKEVHVRVPIPNYQYLDQLARRYGMRSLSAVVNFLIEYHREYRDAPTLGRALPPVKQPE